jgi:putative N6-adenine-specific DNA methylase
MTKQFPESSEFFLVTLPGLEELAAAEVKEWCPGIEAKTEHGGVTVFAPLETGLAMNLVLKIPTRILLRTARFRCRDFPKLFNQISGMNWRLWIDSRCELTVESSTRASRLKMKKRIESTCLDAWKNYQKKHAGKEKREGLQLSLYVRFLKDECTLSLDTSGERLHKRGIRKHIGEAPLRETIAAALIQLVGRTYEDPGHVAVEVIDPMMGSGTFLLEAVARDLPVDRRGFPFAAFRLKPGEPPRLGSSRPRIESLLGFESDKDAIAAANENLKALALPIAQKTVAIDFFKARPLPAATQQRWLFANPPYGERLKVDEPLGQYYAKLFAAAERFAQPDRACFILPAKAVKGKFPLPLDWQVLVKLPFLNGGIPVVGFVFGRRWSSLR